MSRYIIVEGLHSYSSDEKMFLKQWVNGNAFYTKVRNEYKNKNPNRVLEKMFSTYDSKYAKNIPIYRGLSFNKNNPKEVELYQELYNYFLESFECKDNVVADFAPASFSLQDNVANKFSKNEDKDYLSIIFKIHIRMMNEIDVCSNEVAMKSIYFNENELLIKFNKMIFTILNLSEKNDILEVSLKEV